MNENEKNPTPSRPRPQFGIGAIVRHKFLGRGRIAAYEAGTYVIHFRDETKRVPFGFTDMTAEGDGGSPELDLLRAAVREVLGDHGWIETELELAPRWVGGTLVLRPGREGAEAKEIPIDAFLKKIIGVREKLRVLEQKLNNHPRLDPEEKLDLQGYITRCYGSLTTFNVLFSDKRSHFRGTGGRSTEDETA